LWIQKAIITYNSLFLYIRYEMHHRGKKKKKMAAIVLCVECWIEALNFLAAFLAAYKFILFITISQRVVFN